MSINLASFQYVLVRLYPVVVVALTIAGARRYQALDRARRALVWWLVANAIASVAGFIGARVFKNAQPAALLWYPVSAPLAVCVAAAMGRTPAWRRRAYLVAGLVGAAMVGITIGVEQIGAFAKLTGAIHGVVVLLVGAWIVLDRAAVARRELSSDVLFLVGVGFILIGAPSPFLTLAAHYFGIEEFRIRTPLYVVRNVMALLAYALMYHAFRHRRDAGLQPLAESTA